MARRIRWRISPTRTDHLTQLRLDLNPRLRRHPLSNAFRERAYAAGRTNPSYKGVGWLLSGSQPLTDICDDFAEAGPLMTS